MNIPDSPLSDPNYPNRPTHADFARLVEIVLELDGGFEGKRPGGAGGDDDQVDSIIRSAIDPDSLSYMAIERALRAVMFGTGGNDPVLRAAACYLEAFVTGYRFRDRYGTKGKRKQG